jgi:hypothetical protein
MSLVHILDIFCIQIVFLYANCWERLASLAQYYSFKSTLSEPQIATMIALLSTADGWEPGGGFRVIPMIPMIHNSKERPAVNGQTTNYFASRGSCVLVVE